MASVKQEVLKETAEGERGFPDKEITVGGTGQVSGVKETEIEDPESEKNGRGQVLC